MNIKDALGNTPLHYAYQKKYNLWLYAPKVFDLLLESGAKTTIKNNTGLVPAEIEPCKQNVIQFWNNDIVNKALQFPEIIFDVVDNNGETAVLFLLRTIKFKNSFLCENYTIYRYSFSPKNLEQIILLSNLNYKNQGETAYDALLKNYKKFDCYSDHLTLLSSSSPYWRWNTSPIWQRDTYRYTRPFVLADLIKLMIAKGYDFDKNKQTDLSMLPQDFLYESIIKMLLHAGINFGNSQFFDNTNLNTFMEKLTQYDAVSTDIEKMKKFICTKENKDYLNLIFSYALAKKHTQTITLFGKLFDTSFSPLSALEIACHNNGAKSVPFIVKNFSPKTCTNVMYLIDKEKALYTSDEKIYEQLYNLYQEAKKNGNIDFCNSMYDACKLVWLFSKKYTKMPKDLKNHLFDYL